MFIDSRHRLPLHSSRSWDDELLDARRYQVLFEALRRRAASRPSLLAAPRRAGAIGLRWLLAHEAQVTQRILEALVTPGFRLGHQHKVRVFAGKAREIYVADWPDRLVLMVMGRLLSERLEAVLTDRVFSFRQGRSHWDALGQLRRFLKDVPRGAPVHVLRRDIRRYGDSVLQPRVLALTEERLGIVPDSLFGRVLRQGVRVVHSGEDAPASLARGIPSGSPLCPPLENLYLDVIDRTLQALPGAFYARYGDDFLVATGREASAAQAREAVAALVPALGLTASPDKALDVTLVSPSQGFEWLGLRVGREGRLGCKRARWREARRRVSLELDRFVEVAFRAELEEPQRLALLRVGLARLLDPSGSPWLASMVFEQDDPVALAELDRHLSQHLAGTLGRRLGGGRQRGWRLFRKLGYRSLLHARAQERWA
jgi:hypothetical protein